MSLFPSLVLANPLFANDPQIHRHLLTYKHSNRQTALLTSEPGNSTRTVNILSRNYLQHHHPALFLEASQFGAKKRGIAFSLPLASYAHIPPYISSSWLAAFLYSDSFLKRCLLTSVFSIATRDLAESWSGLCSPALLFCRPASNPSHPAASAPSLQQASSHSPSPRSLQGLSFSRLKPHSSWSPGHFAVWSCLLCSWARHRLGPWLCTQTRAWPPAAFEPQPLWPPACPGSCLRYDTLWQGASSVTPPF